MPIITYKNAPNIPYGMENRHERILSALRIAGYAVVASTLKGVPAQRVIMPRRGDRICQLVIVRKVA